MLVGDYIHNLDIKGRIFMPSKFRDDMSDGFVATKGMERTMAIYSRKEWERIEAAVRKLPTAEARNFRLVMSSGAAELEIDKQGRFVIPQKLREYANLEGDVAFIGLSDHIEIWTKERWDEYNKENEKKKEEKPVDMVAEVMATLVVE